MGIAMTDISGSMIRTIRKSGRVFVVASPNVSINNDSGS
jgi:hypothetical protein